MHRHDRVLERGSPHEPLATERMGQAGPAEKPLGPVQIEVVVAVRSLEVQSASRFVNGGITRHRQATRQPAWVVAVTPIWSHRTWQPLLGGGGGLGGLGLGRLGLGGGAVQPTVGHLCRSQSVHVTEGGTSLSRANVVSVGAGTGLHSCHGVWHSCALLFVCSWLNGSGMQAMRGRCAYSPSASDSTDQLSGTVP
jgi:hypothetical protein